MNSSGSYVRESRMIPKVVHHVLVRFKQRATSPMHQHEIVSSNKIAETLRDSASTGGRMTYPHQIQGLRQPTPPGTGTPHGKQRHGVDWKNAMIAVPFNLASTEGLLAIAPGIAVTRSQSHLQCL